MPSVTPAKTQRRSELYFSENSVSARFGRRLREMRNDRNWSQVAMANRFGIDRTFISDVERGRKTIGLPLLNIIAMGMKVSISELLSQIEDDTHPSSPLSGGSFRRYPGLS
jgi:transcriptional regulator with XRE-family HTH domain